MRGCPPKSVVNLTSFDLFDNQLKTLPAQIGRLINLRTLYLFDNQLTELPAEIGKLSKLRSFYLAGNKLTTLPSQISRLTDLESLDLRGNPLPILPQILARTDEPAVIIEHFKTEVESKKQLHEAKMLLIGPAEAGKTSLVKRLIDDNYDPDEKPTLGIDIRQWDMIVNEKPFRLNVWDFGGQDIMYATHQSFLTKRSLYLLVLSTRDKQRQLEKDLEYWLKMIQSFGGTASVIVVINKVDLSQKNIDFYFWGKKYPNIKAFVKTSCATGEGIGYLSTNIHREIYQLEHLGHLFPRQWLSIKSQLENDAEYFSYRDYQHQCEAQGIYEPEEQRECLELLHDLGTILRFSNHAELDRTQLLNPKWVANGIYKILNANLLEQKNGRLEYAELNTILDPDRYPKPRFIIDLMHQLELCYGLGPQEFLVPDLLSEQKPDSKDLHKNATLGFQYEYDVLPSSIITRFVVRTYKDSQPDDVWRDGTFLSYADNDNNNNKAWITADRDKRKILVWVAGSEVTASTFLSIIRAHFDEIHQTIPGIEITPLVFPPGRPDVEPIKYDDLLEMEATEILTCVSRSEAGALEKFEVKPWLDQIAPNRVRDKPEQDEQHSSSPLTLLSLQQSQPDFAEKITATVRTQHYLDLKKIKHVLDSSAEQYAERARVLCRVVAYLFLLALCAVILVAVPREDFPRWAFVISYLLPTLLLLISTVLLYFFPKERFSNTIYDRVLQRQKKTKYNQFDLDLAQYEELEQKVTEDQKLEVEWEELILAL